jgi:hypothetical protein
VQFLGLTGNHPQSVTFHTADRWQQAKKKLQYMDTDDLSREAYNGILIEAEKLTHDLTLHFGLLSSDCIDETEYIDKAEKLTKEIMQVEDWELDDLFWGDPPNKEKLIFTCKKILKNIEKVKTIPIEKRKYDF